ncbi:hypothetical protein SERLA73DRAFT_191646 [Serpula lacrymans var. lacrymans S7.3]|uniref:DinB-like domain-containing protein n=2 Tax=Serpula lacrymans var. lacrymans TaxID=341189 RepID=F8QI06_SERL3|nr:uncharacterized protein SERLADRAFT_459625 [Serpula lacrymans var. lacrymans S7.9]EGN92069.1 hypothetical protein SERLA73DRAFT_191646 [Serpula lacrymans var. lacrymans S7.3]EGO28811.1 hypothetical protein SERLADRAFT_459625 [Serpula lacrymans var. lacrymans S7.9]
MVSSSEHIQRSNGSTSDNGEDSPLSQLLFVSTTVLQQAVDLVENVLTTDDQLTTQSKFLPGSTIGRHLRHARDHFVLLVDCIAEPEPHILSYDTRSRNTPMETSLGSARDSLKDAISRLEDIVPKTSLEQPMTLNAVTPFMQTLETTFGRELWFASLHAVHHWSMVRVIAGEMDITLQDSFGFAPSTLMYKGTDVLSGKAKI